MVTKEQKIRLGIFLIISFGILVVVLAVFLIPKLSDQGEVYYINFKETSVNGLYVGSPVKYQGVEVGKVDRISVNHEDLNSILVHTKLRKQFPIKKDMTATLMYMGITGQKFVELSGGNNDSESLEPKGEIPTRRGLGEKAEDIVSNIDSAVKGINNLLDPENQKRISLFLENAEKSATILSSVLEEKRSHLENSLTNLEKATLEFGEVTANLSKISQDLGKLTGTLESQSGQALDNLNKRFSDEEMGKVLRNLEAFIETASTSLNKIETVLIRQQEEVKNTFQSLAEAIDNLSKFSREMTEDPTLFIRGRKEKKK
ncbi:MAG: MCE family protein [Candidatus Aminicenantes bacterium]|nr:MCE family protein [Candidatus Aminicenantes bacterium]